MGRELNPRFLGIDVKQNLFRAALVAWLAIDWMYAMDRFNSKQTVEPALALVVLFHTLYVFFSVKNEVICSLCFVTAPRGLCRGRQL